MIALQRLEYQSNVISRLKGISELIGAYDDTAVHALAAQSMTGKTTLLLTLMYDYSDQTGLDTCFFDTEGGARKFVEKWDKVLKKRYPKAKTPLIYICRNYREILKDHGRIVNVKTGDTGKMTPVLKATVEEGTRFKDDDGKIKKVQAPKFIQYIRDNNIGFVAYDSFTSPFASEFPPSPENFPCRNYFQMLWYRCIIDLVIDKEKCIVWTLHHMSKSPLPDPRNPEANEEQMTGGKAVRHNSKVIIYMKKFSAMGAKSFRKIHLVRYYNKNPEEKEESVRYLNLTSKCYVDVLESDMEASKAQARADKKK